MDVYHHSVLMNNSRSEERLKAEISLFRSILMYVIVMRKVMLNTIVINVLFAWIDTIYCDQYHIALA